MAESEKKTLIEAVNLALDHALSEDEDVVVLGEDVGTNGGVFRATVDLKKKYGLMRVMDTPLAETLIAGMTVGMATQGLKPVAEVQFMGFVFACMEQLVGHAARMRNRTRGRLTCPMVVRAPFGGGIHAPEHHSESTEALFAHIPGLRVVIPSSPIRAYGLLRSAIDNPDPVIFLEPKRIYRVQKQTLPAPGSRLPLDTCFTLKEGNDLTLVTWGACVKECLEVSHLLADESISVELIDVATIKPLDMDTILASSRKTGRCVIVHEAARSFGVGAEIAAMVSTELFHELYEPVQRIAGFDITMPYYRMEEHYLPGVNRIKRACLSVMGR